MLQFALSSKNRKILYVSGEESQKQIKMQLKELIKILITVIFLQKHRHKIYFYK